MPGSLPTSTLEKFTSFGDYLRFLRRRAGVTQLELSIAVGYSDAQISRLEQNLRLPDIPTIEARFIAPLGLEDEPAAVARLLDLAANVRREDAPVLGLCPYKGLSYFDEADADLFVGREALTTNLVERVLSLTSSDRRFLGIVGASGSGKSSLARAGLVPAIRWNQESANWPVHVLTPTAHPLESLAASLTADAGSVATTAALMDDLSHEPRSLNLFFKRVLKPPTRCSFLLVVDQFEELFTLCRSEEERAAFIDNLVTAASDPDGPAIVVITLRADFYAYCASYAHLREALSRQQEYIGAMSHEELRRAIEEPARRGRWELEPGLVDLLLHDVGQEPGALPLLSHALLETWQRRRGRTLTLSGYASSGGVRGAIAETAEAVFADQFTNEQQAIARHIFLRLTELGDETATGDTRRRAKFTELILKPEKAAQTQTVLKALADARLIATSEDSVEVAHEALIREWPTLRGWLEENREGLRLHRQITNSSLDWLAQQREPDLLYRGARLAQAREWAAVHPDEMNALEREFLESSQAWVEHESAERELQRQRELETAQKLAEAERKRAEEQAHSAKQLRTRAQYLAGAFIIALAMAFTALFFGAQARQAAITAQQQQRIAFSRELAAAAISNLETDPERSILLALQAVEVTYSDDNTWIIEAEDALRRALLASRVEFTLRGHADLVASVAFSPDGMSLATASDDGTVKVWDMASGQTVLTLSTNARRGHHGMAFSPDGTWLATASDQMTAKVWDAATGQEELTLRGHTDWISSVDFSPDGKHLVTASEDRTAKVWDLATGQQILTITGHTGEVWSAVFSPDGTRIATASEDSKVIVWDSTTGQEYLTLPSHVGAVYGVAFSPDGTRLATTGGDGSAKIWDAETGNELLTLRGHTELVASLAFSPDGMRLATTSFDGKLKVWDTVNGQTMLTLTGHTAATLGVDFSPDGKRLASTSFDGTVKVWNASLSRELLSLEIPSSYSRMLSPDGSLLAAGFGDGTIHLWDMASDLNSGAPSGSELPVLQGHKGSVSQVAFSPDGASLATASEDKTVKLWDLPTGRERLTLSGLTSEVNSLAFSPDGARLATTGTDYTIKVWDLEKKTGQVLLTLGGMPWSTKVAFSPDGTRLAAGTGDGAAKVWEVATGQEQFVLRGHTDEVLSIAFSPDGTRLATASNDRTVRVWESTNGQEVIVIRGHTSAVNDVAFSPDATRLATAGQDGTVKMWDAATGQDVLTLYGHTGAVVRVAYSADGTRLLTAGADGTIRVYLLGIEDLVALASTRVTRTITAAECQQYLHLPLEKCAQDSEAVSTSPANTPDAMMTQSGRLSGKVCELTDEAGVDDQSFNQIAYRGVQEAAETYGWQTALLESESPGDFQKNINTFQQSSCDLIVIPFGFYYSDAIYAAGDANPGQKFITLDSAMDTPLDNIRSHYYATDQAAFLAGYVAASVTQTGVVGTFGGLNILPVTQFMDGFALGIAYFNEKNSAQVRVLGWDISTRDGYFSGDFINIDEGHRIGERLMNEGADVILPVAGGVGLGAAAAVKEHGDAYIIGVDSDWAVTYPEYADIILTSIEKRLDVSVVSAVKSIIEGTFTGGTHVGTLENGGVSIAPFHQLEGLVSDQTRVELEQVKGDIIGGKVKTLP